MCLVLSHHGDIYLCVFIVSNVALKAKIKSKATYTFMRERNRQAKTKKKYEKKESGMKTRMQWKIISNIKEFIM